MEMTIAREEGDVTPETVESCQETVKEITRGYSPRDVQNLDETGSFRKAEGQMLEWREKFNALDYSSFLCECSQRKREPVLIGKNKKPRCFAKLNDISHPGGAFYFSNDKAWMDTEIMIEILKKLSSWMKRGKRNIMFLDNAPCHPQTLTGMLM